MIFVRSYRFYDLHGLSAKNMHAEKEYKGHFPSAYRCKPVTDKQRLVFVTKGFAYLSIGLLSHKYGQQKMKRI